MGVEEEEKKVIKKEEEKKEKVEKKEEVKKTYDWKKGVKKVEKKEVEEPKAPEKVVLKKPKHIEKPKEVPQEGIKLKPIPAKEKAEPEKKEDIKLKPVPPKEKEAASEGSKNVKVSKKVEKDIKTSKEILKNEDEADESNKQEENVKTLAHSLSQEDKILNIKEPEQKDSDSLNMPKHHAQENNNTISETSCNINNEVNEKAETSCQSEPQPGSMLTESVNEEKTDHIKKDDAIKQLSNSKSEADESIISPEKPIQNATEIEMKKNKVSPSEKTPEDNVDMENDISPTQIATLENKGEGKPSNLELEEKMPKIIDSKTPPIVDIKKIPELDKEKEFSKENAKKAEEEINEKMIYDTVESNEKAEVTIEKKETPQESLITNEMQVLEQKEVAKKKIDSDANVEDQKTSKKLDVETKTKEQIESSTKKKKKKKKKKWGKQKKKKKKKKKKK